MRQKLLNFLLQNAAVLGKTRAVRLLLAWGADPNVRDRMPMGVETVDEHGNTLSVSPPRQHLSTVLMGAAIAGQPAVIALLVAHGAEVDARDADGRTALIYAATMEQPEAAKALLAAGADVNARDIEGRTALGWALHLQKPAMLTVVENAGGVK